MDIFRAAYSTDCVFNRDSDLTAKIVWYEANEDAKPLPFFSAVCNLDWEIDPWQQQHVGEVYGAERKYSPGKRKPGTGLGGYCGDPLDFEEGGHEDDSLPPVIYGSNGLPACCGPVVSGRGGVGFGGRATLPTPVVRRGRGGFGLAGKSGATGCGDGSSCTLAACGSSILTWSITYTTPPLSYWVRFANVPAGVYHSIVDPSTWIAWRIWYGTGCGDLTLAPLTTHAGDITCTDWTLPSDTTMWLEFALSTNAFVNGRIDPGACPP